ncbi:MAG: glutamate racemase [Robiginitomaculum sp.]|nr:glutamate racemase [Robiginitomaculum sp.]
MAHILVFDSGVGGLSVVVELRALMPSVYITYVADDEFRPYGDKSETQLKARLPGLLQTLVLAVDPDIVVLACNTASTSALAEIREALKVPVIGVVPAIKPAAQLSRNKHIAVLGTPGTVQRKYVGKLMNDFAKDCRVVLQGSNVLVGLAENKLAGDHVDIAKIKFEIAPIFAGADGANIDVVVLACTHFPLLLDELKEAAPHFVKWIDSGTAIATRAQSLLKNLSLKPAPDTPQTALLIGGQTNQTRRQVFKKHGFEKTVIL